MKYRIRLLWRGDGPFPLPEDDQVEVLDEIHEAHIGTLAEWMNGIAGSHSDDPALIVEDCGLPPTEGGGAFWNEDATGALHLLGINVERVIGIVPKHGYRLVAEAAPWARSIRLVSFFWSVLLSVT